MANFIKLTAAGAKEAIYLEVDNIFCVQMYDGNGAKSSVRISEGIVYALETPDEIAAMLPASAFHAFTGYSNGEKLLIQKSKITAVNKHSAPNITCLTCAAGGSYGLKETVEDVMALLTGGDGK